MPDPVIIADYDPSWPARYAAEAERLIANLGTGYPIEHIGSTSVPAMPAKPVIDIVIAVDDDSLLDTSAEVEAVRGEQTPILPAGNEGHVGLVNAVIACDFTYRGVNGLPGRLYFFRHGHNSAHVHVAQRDSWIVHDYLVFRDWLRVHPDDAKSYETLKRDLSAMYRDDRVAYTMSKSEFIRGILLQAGGKGPWLQES